MGRVGRPSSRKNHDSGSEIVLFKKANTKKNSSAKLPHIGEKHCDFGGDFSSQMGGKNDNKRDFRSNSTSFFNHLHETEEKWETQTYNRSIRIEQAANFGEIQDGNSRSNFSDHSRNSLGVLNRYRGRIFSCADKLGFPKIFSIQNQESGFRLSISPIWSVSSALGVYKSTETGEGATTHSAFDCIQLHRRFYLVRSFSRSIIKKCSGSTGVASKTRFQDKLGQISTDSNTEHRVFGSTMGLSEQDTFSSTVKNQRYNQVMQGNGNEEYVIEAYDRTTSGEVGLRSILHRVGQTLLTTSVDLDELAHGDGVARRPCSLGQSVQNKTENLGEQGVSEPMGSFCEGSAKSHSDDRCVTGGMVRSTASSESDGDLESGCCSQINQLERIDDCETCPAEFSGSVVRSVHSPSVRQYDDGVLSEEAGDSTQRGVASLDNGDLGTLQGEQYSPGSRTPSGCEQRPGGSRLQNESSQYRMEVGCGDLQVASAEVLHVGDRSFCNQNECTSSVVRVPFPGRGSCGMRCIQHGLESVGGHLSFSSSEHSRKGPSQAGRLSGIRGSNSSILAIQELVPRVEEEVHRAPSPTACESQSEPMDFEGFSNMPQREFLEASRLASMIAFLPEGCSEETIGMIMRAHRDGTIKQYQGTWTKFIKYLRDNNINHANVKLSVVMNFLAHCSKDLGLQYKTVAVYKCSLEAPLKLIFDLSLDTLSFRLFMKGLWNFRPPLKAKPGPTWVLDVLLAYLQSNRFEPLARKKPETLATKLLCLLLLATGRRIGEISNLSLKHTLIHGGEAMELCWLKGFTTKHFNEGFIPTLPIVEKMVIREGGNDILCPFRALNIYINSVRNAQRCTNTVRFWNYKSSQLTGFFKKCIVRALQFAHVPRNGDIGPHQVRKLAASYSQIMINKDPALKEKLHVRMGSKGLNVLKSVYIQNVPQLDTRCVIPVGTFHPEDHGE